jgi:hypothetical protein
MDSCIEDENTIFICSEQSEKIDKNFNSGKYAYVSASVVSAIPVYASWNNERYNTTPQEVAEDYFSATFYLKMSCFEAIITEGTPKLLEHNDAKWLTKDQLDTINWIPADIEAVNYLKESMDD